MTDNLKRFALFCIVWSVPYFAALGWSIDGIEQRWPQLVLAGAVYMAGFSLVGYLLGKGDDAAKVRYSLRHAYAATSCLAAAGVGSLWVVLFRPLAHTALVVYLAIMLAVAVAGFVQYKLSIKGMSNKKLFK